MHVRIKLHHINEESLVYAMYKSMTNTWKAEPKKIISIQISNRNERDNEELKTGSVFKTHGWQKWGRKSAEIEKQRKSCKGESHTRWLELLDLLTAYSSGVTFRTSNTTASKLFFSSAEPLSLKDSELLLFCRNKKTLRMFWTVLFFLSSLFYTPKRKISVQMSLFT